MKKPKADPVWVLILAHFVRSSLISCGIFFVIFIPGFFIMLYLNIGAPVNFFDFFAAHPHIYMFLMLVIWSFAVWVGVKRSAKVLKDEYTITNSKVVAAISTIPWAILIITLSHYSVKEKR